MTLGAKGFEYRWGAKQRGPDRIIIRAPLWKSTTFLIEYARFCRVHSYLFLNRDHPKFCVNLRCGVE